jgi:hypothetical protein
MSAAAVAAAAVIDASEMNARAMAAMLRTAPGVTAGTLQRESPHAWD